MQIKQVSRLTGLSERTIRFYEAERLFSPAQQNVNGRSFREYSQADVEALLTIAGLRRAFFTIQDIRDMQATPARIPAVLAEFKQKTGQEIATKQQIVQTIDRLDPSQVRDIVSLEAALRRSTERLSLPAIDVRPSFGRMDGISATEREEAYQAYLQREEQRFRTGRILVFAIASVNVLMTLAGSLIQFNLFSVIIQIGLSIALYAGVSWVRWWFVAGAALNLLISAAFLLNNLSAGLPGILLAYLLSNAAFSAASAVLLLKNAAVHEFLYSQRGC